MAASLKEGQVPSTALGDYVLVATPGTGGDCGYYATLQSLYYLTGSSYFRKTEMQESVKRGLAAADESQNATMNWLRADQIAQYLFSIGVQLFVVVEGKESLADSQVVSMERTSLKAISVAKLIFGL